jgi:hypothetical protein
MNSKFETPSNFASPGKYLNKKNPPNITTKIKNKNTIKKQVHGKKIN